MKKDTAIIKKLLVVTIILAVVTISIIAFVGVYIKKLNKMSDVIPDYTFGSEIEGAREYKFVLDTSENEKEVYIDENGNIRGEVISESSSDTDDIEVTVEGGENTTQENNIEGYTKETRTIKANDDSVLTLDSYKKSKAIIEKRLEKLGVEEYNVRLDEVSGNLIVELPDNEETSFRYSVISSKGEFSIIDSQTGLELLNNDQVTKATVNYGADNGAYSVYLQVYFNKEGSEKLKYITENYVEKNVEKSEEDNTTENAEELELSEENSTEETTDETEIYYIEAKLDGETILKTYFGDYKPDSFLPITLDSNITDSERLQASIKSANAIATLINTGKVPNKYQMENDNFLKSTITKNDIENVKLAFAIGIAVLSIVLIIRFGLNGLIGAILNIGYLATVSIAMRYTNVTVTISSLITAVLVIAINFGFMYNLLTKLNNDKKASDSFNSAVKTLYLAIIPVCIVAFVFTFMENATITGIGMVLFWGLLVELVYNFIFVRSIYVLKDK